MPSQDENTKSLRLIHLSLQHPVLVYARIVVLLIVGCFPYAEPSFAQIGKSDCSQDCLHISISTEKATVDRRSLESLIIVLTLKNCGDRSIPLPTAGSAATGAIIYFLKNGSGRRINICQPTSGVPCVNCSPCKNSTAELASGAEIMLNVPILKYLSGKPKNGIHYFQFFYEAPIRNGTGYYSQKSKPLEIEIR